MTRLSPCMRSMLTGEVAVAALAARRREPERKSKAAKAGGGRKNY